ncbi:MAG: hypothetical protein V7746_20850 [Halioglobus sp.]
MTYGSFLARSMSMVVLLPLILTRLDTDEIYLWFLFSAVTGFQLVFDLGFSPTFSRIIAFAMGGATVSSIGDPEGGDSDEPNWDYLQRLCSSMGYVYFRLSALWLIALLTVGTLVIVGPIAVVENSNSGWLAWIIVVVSSTITMGGIVYSAFLQGVNEIALLRRWEIFFSIGSTATSVLVLLLTGDLLFVVISQQGWLVAGIVRNAWLTRTVFVKPIAIYSKRIRDTEILHVIWPSTWRTGIGAITGYGVVQTSGIVYAQLASPQESAAYFLALRLIQLVSQFSQAPFYSKLPSLARLYAQGYVSEVVELAKKGMRLSYLSFLAGFLGLAVIGTPALDFIDSNAKFPDSTMWLLLGIAYFIERYGAMHINLYSTTNHIVNHIANGVSGIIYLAIGIVGYRYLGLYAFPFALIAGNIGFYAWYAAMHSYRSFELQFFTFESTVMLPFAGVIATYTILYFVFE